ncbi:MAG: glycosyltransferase family 1 protein [Cyanobacteria bacterium]|nr:glycosyltransferase family 1 protein [Cyanobacteria bacterium GSL.Bin1]
MHNILFITGSEGDFLSDSLLHGFKSLSEKIQVTDYPKKDLIYKQGLSKKYQIHGGGFTIYGLLNDVSVDRSNIRKKLSKGIFDLIIFADIFRSFGLFLEFLPYLSFNNTIIIDGADTPQPYPYAGKFWRYPKWWFLPRAHTDFLYFKREWTPETIRNLHYQLVPQPLVKYFPTPKNFRRISFSIPEEKIIKELPKKIKTFPKHIVDKEVAENIEGSYTGYAFDNETDYYADLQASKFGITTKRSGWDCLRHYEIAANGCVPCFRDLDQKPDTCAPHGLDESNCIIYHNYEELVSKVKAIDEKKYQELQANALSWVKQNTTVARAQEILSIFEKVK